MFSATMYIVIVWKQDEIACFATHIMKYDCIYHESRLQAVYLALEDELSKNRSGIRWQARGVECRQHNAKISLGCRALLVALRLKV